MTPAERTAKIAELRAEADRLEREGDIMAKAVSGALFRSYGRIVLIPPSYPNTYALALTGESIGCQCYGWSEDPNLEYLGHARDLLAIKTPDAPNESLYAALLDLERLYRGTNRESREMNAVLRKMDAIRTPCEELPDAPEPTGVELVGKVCEFSLDGKEWVAIGRCDKYCGPDDREPFRFFCDQSGPRYGWWSFARLHREDRP